MVSARSIVSLSLAGLALAAAVPAGASVSVLGGSYARECFGAAERNMNARQALPICDRALESETLSARDRAATYVNRGIIRMRTRDLDGAIADYDEALRVQPGLAEAYVNKGVALLNRGSEDAAIKALDRALALGPARPEIAFYTRGLAHEIAGRLQQAYEDYRTAADLKPDWPTPAQELKRFSVERRPVGRG